MTFTVVQRYGYTLPSWDGLTRLVNSPFAPKQQIALVSGHAGSDSGAVCTAENGTVELTEADLNASIAEYTAHRLRSDGFEVSILEEYDSRLSGLTADLFLSLHSDSCIDESGYKAARHPNSPIAEQEDRFLVCLDKHYAQETGLVNHPNTLTHDMLEYHAFRKVDPQTPALILEMGFMGGDKHLLSSEESQVAKGIAESIRCFIENENTSK